MVTMQEALIFDCDGTLADTMPVHYRAWLALLAPFGATFDEARFYALGGVPTTTIARMLVGELGLSVDPAELAARKEQAFVDQIPHVRPVEKVVAIAAQGRGRVPMAVASGGPRGVVELTLRQIGVFDWFGAVVGAEDTVRHKPEPDVFLEAARRLGATPAICTVYEDTDLGLEAARRAGMRGVDIRRL